MGVLSGQRKATRRRILRGAASILGRRGLARTSVEDVLTAAGVSRRTFYQYFRSLDDVVSALFDQVAHQTVSMTREALGEPTPAGRIERLIELFFASQRPVAAVFRVLLAESLHTDSPFASRRLAVIEEVVDLVEKGLGRRTDRDVLRSLFLMAESSALHALRSRNWRSRHERAQRAVLRIFMKTLQLEKGAHRGSRAHAG